MPGERDALRDWHRLFGLLLTDFFTGLPFIVEVERDLSEQQQFLDVPDAVGATWSSSASRTLGFRRDANRVSQGFLRSATAIATPAARIARNNAQFFRLCSSRAVLRSSISFWSTATSAFRSFKALKVVVCFVSTLEISRWQTSTVVLITATLVPPSPTSA